MGPLRFAQVAPPPLPVRQGCGPRLWWRAFSGWGSPPLRVRAAFGPPLRTRRGSCRRRSRRLAVSPHGGDGPLRIVAAPPLPLGRGCAVIPRCVLPLTHAALPMRSRADFGGRGGRRRRRVPYAVKVTPVALDAQRSSCGYLSAPCPYHTRCLNVRTPDATETHSIGISSQLVVSALWPHRPAIVRTSFAHCACIGPIPSDQCLRSEP